jgi:hypothetical protein
MQFVKCEFWDTQLPVIPGAQFHECTFVDVDKLPDPAQCRNCTVVDENGVNEQYGTMPYAIDNDDGTGSLKGKLVGMGF